MISNIPTINHSNSGNFFIMAGPCAIEGEEIAVNLANKILDITSKLEIPFIFTGSFNKANSYLFKNGQNGYVGGAGEFFLISLYANEINECLLMLGGTIMSNRMWTSTRNKKFSNS